MSIRFYQDHEVRAVWDEATKKWWFAAVDVVGAINGEGGTKARNYWKWLKRQLDDDQPVSATNKLKNGQLVSDTNQLKNRQSSSMTRQLKMTADDGKRYLTDVLDKSGISELAHSIHNDKAKDFLEWFEYSENTKSD